MTIRLALLGTASFAQAHTEAARAAGADVVLLHGREQGRAEVRAKELGIPLATTDLEAMLNESSVDAVTIVTEPERHLPLARRVAAAGKHLLIEKPVGTDSADADSFMKESTGYGVVTGVVAPLRFDPVLIAMRERYHSVKGEGGHATLEIFRSRSDDYYRAGTGWRSAGSHFFLNQAIHWLDVLNWFFGEPCEVVARPTAGRAGVTCSDRAVGVVRYGGGINVTVAGGSFVHTGRDDRFVIHTPGATLDYQAIKTEMRGAKRGLFGRAKTAPNLMKLHYDDFLAAIREGREPRTTLKQGVEALRLALPFSR